jgi:hypothetical protein
MMDLFNNKYSGSTFDQIGTTRHKTSSGRRATSSITSITPCRQPRDLLPENRSAILTCLVASIMRVQRLEHHGARLKGLPQRLCQFSVYRLSPHVWKIGLDAGEAARGWSTRKSVAFQVISALGIKARVQRTRLMKRSLSLFIFHSCI